jgi:hypothetical protein
MSNLRARVRALEKRLTDSTGLVPHSRAWLEFWFDNTDRLMAGDKSARRISVEFYRIWAGITPLEKLDSTTREVVLRRRLERGGATGRSKRTQSDTTGETLRR